MPRRLKLGRKLRNKKRKIALSRSSPFTGIRFPEGSKRIAFVHFCEAGGNIRATRRSLQRDGERTPSVKTLTAWAEANHWEVLREMVDDGILDYLDAQDDPDIRDAIKDDVGLFKLLLRLRSTLYINLSARNSLLMPRNTGDLVKILGHIKTELGTITDRVDKARDRRSGSLSDMGSQVPDNVISLTAASAADRLQDRGEGVTQSNVARELLKMKEEQQEIG